MHIIQHYIDVQRETIAKYVVDRSILPRNFRRQTKGTVWCLDGGGGSRGCAWMTFDAIGSSN